ncbi:hypothetical protein ACRAQ7_10750 [Erythrobacter sp. W53]|uniref:hypothetical protein n=1 Tax=Erythrobacter sp. W53 TaxID=3425947 RepID=UPI003D7686A5
MFRYIAVIGAAVFLSLQSSFAVAQAPIPIRDGYVTEGFKGWEKVESKTPDGNGMQYMHRPRGGPHKGSAAWFFGMIGSDKAAAFIAAAKAGGITDVKILASHPMQKAKLLDNRGSGAAFIAEGTRTGKGPYKMAALVIHGTLDRSEEPGLGVHMFVAPQGMYGEMGGWVVPASLFLNLDPYKEVRDTRAQGDAAPPLQARRLAGIADIWSEWVLNEYIRMAQSNITALSNARQSIVCAGDPSCVIVPAN